MKPSLDLQHQNLLFAHRTEAAQLTSASLPVIPSGTKLRNIMTLRAISCSQVCYSAKDPGAPCSPPGDTEPPPAPLTCSGITWLKRCICTRNKSTFNILQLLKKFFEQYFTDQHRHYTDLVRLHIRTKMTWKNLRLLPFPESIRGQNLSQDYESLEFVLVFLYEMEILLSSISVGPAETKEVYIINCGRDIFSHGYQDHK